MIDVSELQKMSSTLLKTMNEMAKTSGNLVSFAKEKGNELPEEERVLYNAEMRKIKEVKDKISKEVNTIKNILK